MKQEFRSNDRVGLELGSNGVAQVRLTRGDKLRFLREYFQRPLREILRDEATLLSWLEGKAERLYRRKQRYGDVL